MSYTTRLTDAFILLVMRWEIASRTSSGIFEYVAVIPSIEFTARIAIVLPYRHSID